jgi:hypothetical protein
MQIFIVSNYVHIVTRGQVFYDARRELVSLATLGDTATIAQERSVPTTPKEIRGRLLELLSKTWSNRWLKAAPKKKQPPRDRTKKSGAHTSVSRAQKAYKEAKDSERRRRGTHK